MADQTKNLILKLKLNVDETEGKKLVTLVKEQTQSLAAITAETKKLKDAESERQKQLAAINKQIKEQINEQKAAQKTALDELNKKVTEANAKLELQVKGWQLIPTNIQAAINKYNKLQEALDKEVATKLRLLNIEKESLSIVEEAARQAARKAEFIKKVEAQAVKQKGIDYTLVEKALQESFNRRKQVQDSYNVLISELEAAAYTKKLADFKTYQSLYASTEKEANNTRLKNDKEIISAMAQAAKQAQAESLQNIKAKADLEKAGKVYADEYSAAVAKRVTSEQKITNELRVQNALMNKAVTESITLNTLEELRRSREAAGYSNYKLHLENLLQASKKITAELEVQTQLEAARSKGYSFTGATSSKSTTPALTGSGLTSATSQVQGAYSFTTAGTVAANKEKADKEAADLARIRIQKELTEQTEAAKQLYQIRMGAFKASITEQDALMQHSVALQTAVQIHGINSVQAERVRATEATRQLERTRQATVSDVHAQVSTGGISTTEGMSRIATANKEYASGVVTTTQKVHDLDKALANTTERHRNLFLRVGEAIGAYRIWNTALTYTKEALLSIPKAGIQLESVTATLTAMFGNLGGANRELAFITAEAARTGLAVGQLRESYASFAASMLMAGESAETLRRVFTNVNTIATTLHMTTDAVDSTFLALSQSFNKGKIQAEEMVKQLAQRLPGIYNQAAIALGMTTKELGEQMKKGLVESHGSIDKIMSYMAETFGGAAFERASSGLNSQIGKLSTAWTLLSENMYRASAESLIAIVKFAGGSVDKLNDLSSSVIRLKTQILTLGAEIAGAVAGYVAARIALASYQAILVIAGIATGTLAAETRLLTIALAKNIFTGVIVAAGIYLGKLQEIKLAQINVDEYLDRIAKKQTTKPESSAYKVEQDFRYKEAKSALEEMQKIESLSGKGRTAASEKKIKALLENLNNVKKLVEEELAASTVKTQETYVPSVETPTGAAAAKALKDSYKDIIRASKLANQETETLLDELASKYTSNLVSIKDYYAERVSLQLQNIENEKTFQGEIVKQASAAGDAASVEKARDQIELLNEKAKQFQPIADKERINDLRTYNATLANTTASYLEMTGATLAAAKARLEIQNAPLKQQLQTQSTDLTSTPAERTEATNVLGQVTAGEEITKIRAAAEAAQSYRDQINEVKLAYTQMGATSSDVLTASLGGFAPLSNLFDNFMLALQEMQIKMENLIAIGQVLAQIKIEVKKEGNEDAIAANQKEIENNAKQTQILDKQIAVNKLKTVGEALFTIESLTKKGTIANKVAHMAAIAASIAEKIQLLSLLVVKGAEATLEQGKGGGYEAFARMAAMAALVAGIIADVGGAASSAGSDASGSGGGETTPTKSTSQPPTNPAGTVFGDVAAVSASLEETLAFLTEVNYMSYMELVKLNYYTNKTSISLTNLNKSIASGTLLGPSYAKGKSSKDIMLDIGLQTFETSAQRIFSGGSAYVAQYSTLEKTVEGASGKVKHISDVLQFATTEAVRLVTDIFRNIGNTILTMANKVGEGALVALYKYKFSALKISLFSKESGDLSANITGLVSRELDKISMKVFGAMFKGLRDLKEGMFATVSRLFIQGEIVKGYFKDLGVSFNVNTEEGMKFADALVRVSSNAATGAERLKEFSKQQDEFFKNFATTAIQNLKTVADFSQGLSAVFRQGLSIDQVSKTKAFVDYNKARADLDNAMIKSSKLQRLEANLAKAKTPTAIRNAEKALLPLETTYNTQVATAQENLTKATANYNVGLNGSIEAYQTLKDVFFNTVATTGSFGAALIEVKKNLDLTTDSGMQAFVMLNNLSGEFNKLFEAIVQPIKNQITSIADSIDATSKEDLLKQLTASRDFESQKNISVKIQKLIVDKYTTEKTAINNIKTAFINLAATVKTLLGGDLSTKNPYEKLQLAQTEYTDLLAKSRSTDLTVASDAASKLGASAQAYLTQAKSYFGATAQYADIFNSVTTTLSGLSQTAESAADASTVQLEILGKAAIAELSNLADVTTKAVLATLEEGIKALDITDTTKIATDQLLLLAMKADNLGISFDALIAKFNQEMGTPASNSGSGIQALMDQLTAARLAGDTKEMAKINKQIDAYNKGFGKGGAIVGATYAANRLEYQNNFAAIEQLKKDRLVKGADKPTIDAQIEDLQEKNKLIVKAGAYADGGRVSTGMSLVGERGPELIRLPIGTNVIKNSTTNRLLEDSNKQTINILTDMKKELIILNDRMGTIERKTRLTKPTLSMA